MIENDNQLNVTKQKIKDMQEYLKTRKAYPVADKLIQKALEAGPQSLINDMQMEIDQYEHDREQELIDSIFGGKSLDEYMGCTTREVLKLFYAMSHGCVHVKDHATIMQMCAFLNHFGISIKESEPQAFREKLNDLGIDSGGLPDPKKHETGLLNQPVEASKEGGVLFKGEELRGKGIWDMTIGPVPARRFGETDYEAKE